MKRMTSGIFGLFRAARILWRDARRNDRLGYGAGRQHYKTIFQPIRGGEIFIHGS